MKVLVLRFPPHEDCHGIEAWISCQVGPVPLYDVGSDLRQNLLLSYLKVTIEMSSLLASKENLGRAESRRWGKSKKKLVSLRESLKGILQLWVCKELSLKIKWLSEERTEGFAGVVKVECWNCTAQVNDGGCYRQCWFAFCSWFACYTAWESPD